MRRRDGMPGRSLGPTPQNPTGVVRDLAVGRDVAGRGTIEFEAPPTIGVLETRGDDPVDWGWSPVRR